MKMNEEQLIERDTKRNLGDELLQSVREMKAEKAGFIHTVDVPAIIEARNKIGFTQEMFAELLGVSKRTLQEWEQGRKQPSRAANSLLKIAIKRPDVLQEIFT